MKASKKISMIVMMGLLPGMNALALGVGTTGVPASAKPPKLSDQESTFNACKGLKFVKGKENLSSAKAASANPDCIQALPNLGWLSGAVSDEKEKADAINVMTAAAEQMKANLQKNVAEIQKFKACFDSGSEASKSAECQEKTKALKKVVSEFAPTLRMHQAIARPYSVSGSGAVPNMGWKEGQLEKNVIGGALVNNKMESPIGVLKSVSDVGNPLGYPLNKAERERLAPIMRGMQDQIVDEMKKDPRFAQGLREGRLIMAIPGAATYFTEKWREKQDEHRDAYFKTLFETAPIFAGLTPPAKTDEDGNPLWSDEELKAGLQRLEDNAKKQIETTQKSIDRGVLEFSRFCKNNKNPEDIKKSGWRFGDCDLEGFLERFRKASIGGERDLMDYLFFGPVMEQVLTAHPEYCGTATGLADFAGVKKLQNAGLGIGVGIPVAIGAGILSGGAATAVGGGAAGAAILATEAVAGAGAGLYFGYGTFMGAMQKFNATEQALASRTGASKDEGQIADAKALGEARDAIASEMAFAGLNALNVAGFMKAGKLLGPELVAYLNGTGKSIKALEELKPEQAEQLLTVLRSKLNDPEFRSGKSPDELKKLESRLAQLEAEAKRKKVVGKDFDSKATAAKAQENQQPVLPVESYQTYKANLAKSDAAAASKFDAEVSKAQNDFGHLMKAVTSKEDRDEIGYLIARAREKGRTNEDIERVMVEAQKACRVN